MDRSASHLKSHWHCSDIMWPNGRVIFFRCCRGAILSGSAPLQHCNMGWSISRTRIPTQDVFSDVFQLPVHFWVQWTRTSRAEVWAERQTAQCGQKQAGGNLTWQMDVAYLENLTAWCDEVTHWQDICLYQSRTTAAPPALNRTWIIGFHFGIARRAPLVKSLKPFVPTWEGAVQCHHVTLRCPSRLLMENLLFFFFFYSLQRESLWWKNLARSQIM